MLLADVLEQGYWGVSVELSRGGCVSVGLMHSGMCITTICYSIC